MRPRRPSWLQTKAALSREEIFKSLRGFVSYGSPLQLFSDLWPHTVAVNTNDVFPKGFRWTNIHSPLDPFSGNLRGYRTTAERSNIPFLKPRSFVYNGSPLAFVAHRKYMDAKAKGDSLCGALASMILGRARFDLVRERKWQSLAWKCWTCLQSLSVGGLMVCGMLIEGALLLRILSESATTLAELLRCIVQWFGSGGLEQV